MADKILIKRSLTSGSVPTTASLDVGEIAVNVNDGKLFLRRSGSLGNDVIPLVSIGVNNNGSIIGDFTGSLYGTSSYSLTASYAQNAGLAATPIQNAYKRLRYQISGTLNSNGEAVIALPTSSLGGNAFPVSDLNYVKIDVVINENNKWYNNLVATTLEVSGSPSQIYVTISAIAAANTGYRFLAVNENADNFII